MAENTTKGYTYIYARLAECAVQAKEGCHSWGGHLCRSAIEQDVSLTFQLNATAKGLAIAIVGYIAV